MTQWGPAARVVDAAVATLVDERNRAPAGTFPRPGDAVHGAGLYAWFMDAEGARQLTKGLGKTVAPGLIYAGQAGAGTSSATLKSRLARNHLRGTITGSTFRLTLASLLADSLELVDLGGRSLALEGETRLSEWMVEHLELAVTPVSDRAAIAGIEHAVLDRLNPPLNLQGMPATDVRSALSTRRRRPLGGAR